VTVFNPISRSLLRAGVPLGPNGLITVRGRKSGLRGRPRSRSSSTPVGAGCGHRGARRTGSATCDFVEQEEELKTNRELTRAIHDLTLQVHQAIVDPATAGARTAVPGSVAPDTTPG
jgi:hypothetical protein